MKRAFLLFALVAFFSMTASAQESPKSLETQLDFVRKLRSGGQAELALEHLEKMQKTAAPEKASFIVLELARTRAVLARALDPAGRLAMVNRARAELTDFLQKNPGSPDAVSAQMELAKLSMLQGQALLSEALQQGNVKDQQELAGPAEQEFIKAGEEIEKAAKLLKDDDERRQARFDLARNMMDQIRTYVDIGRNDLNLKRANLVDKARKEFDKVYKEDPKGGVGALAAAWLVKCCQEGDDPKMALDYHRQVMGFSTKAAEPAQRLSRYFRIEYIPKDPTRKLTVAAKLLEVKKEAEGWIKEYPTHLQTPAGYGVRYELALALYNEASVPTKDVKTQAALYKRTQDLLDSLNVPDNDFAEKAKSLNNFIRRQRIGEKTETVNLNNFDDAYVVAKDEMNKVKTVAAQIEKAPSKEEADKLEKIRKKHFKDLIRSLSRALSLVDARTTSASVDEARYFLVVAHLMSGDQHRAAIAGEALGRAAPPSKNSAVAAGYAIEAYANIYNVEASEDNRARLRSLAEYVLGMNAWANDPVAGVARYQLAMLCNKDGDQKAAIDHLQKLPKEFTGYLFAQGQLVFLALATRDKAQTPADKKAFQDLARQTIIKMPKLPPGIDASSAAMYFHAQMEEAKFLYAEGAEALAKDKAKALQKYQQMAGFLDGVGNELQGVKLRDETRDKLAYFVGTMQKYARLGMADVEYARGNYDKVLAPELTGAVVDTIKKEGGQGKEVRVKDFQVIGEILGLALRANVQKGKAEEAKVILKLLENLKGVEDAPFEASTGILRNLVGDLQLQVKELQKSGDQTKLKIVVANFSSFFDALLKQSDKKGLDKAQMFFLARCYDSLDQHEKSAGLYARYPAPTFLDKDVDKMNRILKIDGPKITALVDGKQKELLAVKDVKVKLVVGPGIVEEGLKFDELKVADPKKGRRADFVLADGADKGKVAEIMLRDDEEKDLNTYWYVQAMQARQLRLAGKAKEAKKLLDALQEHKNARQLMLAEKEQTHLLEDTGLYGSAITRWSGYMNALKKNLANDPTLKETYFDAYYHLSYSWYKYSQTEKVKAAQKDTEYLNKAVDYIIRLETAMPPDGWQIVGHKFKNLLDKEKTLGDAYKRKKGV